MEPLVQRILVRTDDFQLAYRIMQLLRTRKINVEQYSIDQPLPEKDSIWVGSIDEVANNSLDGRPIAADLESLDIAVEAAILALKGTSQTHRFILGVDTGPRPGLAWFTDGVLIDTKQTESVEECIETIESLIQHHEFEHLLLRMGKGSPSHRNRLDMQNYSIVGERTKNIQRREKEPTRCFSDSNCNTFWRKGLGTI